MQAERVAHRVVEHRPIPVDLRVVGIAFMVLGAANLVTLFGTGTILGAQWSRHFWDLRLGCFQAGVQIWAGYQLATASRLALHGVIGAAALHLVMILQGAYIPASLSMATLLLTLAGYFGVLIVYTAIRWPTIERWNRDREVAQRRLRMQLRARKRAARTSG